MAGLERNITALPEGDRAGNRALAFMDVNTFKNLYYSLHTEAADRFVDRARSSDGPDKLSQEQLNSTLPEGGDEQLDIMDRFSSPGELMSVYGPLHSRAVEQIFEQYAQDVLASINDPTINSGPTELLTKRIFEYQDYLFENYRGPMSKEEERQKKHLEEMADLMESHARMEEEKQRLEKWQEQWDKDTHTIGGKQFSGADLHNLYLFIQDPANLDRFKQELQKDGVAKEEAEKRADKLKRTLELMEKERQGKISEEEKAELEKLGRDKQVAEDLERMQSIKTMDNKMEASQQNAQTRNAETDERKDSRIANKEQRIDSKNDLKSELNRMLSLSAKQSSGNLSALEREELASLKEDQDLANLMAEMEQEKTRPIELVHQNSEEITQPVSTLSTEPKLAQNAPELKTGADPNSLAATYNPLAQGETNDNVPSQTNSPPPQRLQLAQVSNLDF